MTQLEQINQEKELLKKQIKESVERINAISQGCKMEIKVDLWYNVSMTKKHKLVDTIVDIKLEI